MREAHGWHYEGPHPEVLPSGAWPGGSLEGRTAHLRPYRSLLLRPDVAVDRAMAEIPASTLPHHVIVIGAARADLRTLGAILHCRPVRAHLGAVVVERDHDIGHVVDRARRGSRSVGAQPGGEL